jgi:hypothetical protein
MPSHQNPVGNSKAAKFVAANPLAPLADPFSGMVSDMGIGLCLRFDFFCVDD